MSLTERARRQAERRTSGKVWWVIIGGLAVGGAARAATRHLVFTGAVAVAVLAWWAVSAGWWPWLAAGVGLACLAVGAWCEARPDGWAVLRGRLVARRRLSGYRRGWEDAMDGAGLIRAGYVPGLARVRLGGAARDRDLDVLRVAMAPGQLVSDWRAASPRLVSAFGHLGIRRVRCHGMPDRPDLVDVYAGRRRAVQQRAAFAPPAGRGNNAVTEVEQEEGADVDVPARDEQGQQSGGAFPRAPGRAR